MLEPVVDWVMDVPLSHGERGEAVDPANPRACLCGEPDWLSCPLYLAGGEGTLVHLLRNGRTI